MNLIAKLLAVQEHDVRIHAIERELRDIPARKKAEEQQLTSHRKALAEAEEALKGRQAEIKNLETEVKARRERIAKLRQQQYELKTNREFKTMEEEIKTVEREIAGFEDRELEFMEEVEKAGAAVREKSRALQGEEEIVRKDVERLDARAAVLNGQLAEAQGLRAAAAEGVDPDKLVQYERVAGRRERALVPVQDGVCGGCHMKLPPSIVHDARRPEMITSCGYCGRLLYSASSVGGGDRSL